MKLHIAPSRLKTQAELLMWNETRKLLTTPNSAWTITMKTIFRQDEKTADGIYSTTNPEVGQSLLMNMRKGKIKALLIF